MQIVSHKDLSVDLPYPSAAHWLKKNMTKTKIHDCFSWDKVQYPRLLGNAGEILKTTLRYSVNDPQTQKTPVYHLKPFLPSFPSTL